MTHRTRSIATGVAAGLLLACLQTASAGPAGEPEKAPRKAYVPYQDLPALLDPAVTGAGRAVLMERGAFEKLLARATAARAARGAAGPEVGQVVDARYRADVTGQAYALTGTLTVRSLARGPLAVEAAFAHVALSSVTLDGKPAPLGYVQGKLVAIVPAAGTHELKVVGAGRLKELPGGAMHLGLTVPTAAASTLTLTAPGDLDVHTTAASDKPAYDRATDRTTARMTLGASPTVTVVLTGNGRREDDRAILLAHSATNVQLTPAAATVDCLQTIQVLRRGVRELRFSVPPAYTVTDVACPDLVQWSVSPAPKAGAEAELTVRLRGARRGTQAVRIQATAPRGAGAEADGKWSAPRIALRGAAYQRGYLLVDPGAELRVRGERLRGLQREDRAVAARVAGLTATLQGRLYYHWGDAWEVALDLTPTRLSRTSEDRQTLLVGPRELTLEGTFQVTAVGREMFVMSFVLPPENLGWNVREVLVNGQTSRHRTKGDPTGPFTYRVADDAGRRVLRVELARAVAPDSSAKVAVTLGRAGGELADLLAGADDKADQRDLALPLIQPVCRSVGGVVAVSAQEDLAASLLAAPAAFHRVNVGRMAALGLGRDVQLALTYKQPPAGLLQLRIRRHTPRTAAEGVGLISASAKTLRGDWELTYRITRAAVRRLRLLAATELGEDLDIHVAGYRLASRRIVPDAKPAPPKGYQVWQLDLDSPAKGAVVVPVSYTRPAGFGQAAAGTSVRIVPPLVRPLAERVTEVLAVQADEELAVQVDSTGAAPLDAVDLPPLPVRARRLLSAVRLQSPATPAGAAASVTLKATVHDKVAIPSALAARAELVTCLGPDGAQRTAATFDLVNAGLQFLAIRLPKGAELWTIRVGSDQARPHRNAAGDYLVSLPKTRQALPVQVCYSLAAAQAGRKRTLAAPELPGVKINTVRWQVYPPPGYGIAGEDTRRTGEEPAPPLAVAQIGEAIKRHTSYKFSLARASPPSGAMGPEAIPDARALYEARARLDQARKTGADEVTIERLEEELGDALKEEQKAERDLARTRYAPAKDAEGRQALRKQIEDLKEQVRQKPAKPGGSDRGSALQLHREIDRLEKQLAATDKPTTPGVPEPKPPMTPALPTKPTGEGKGKPGEATGPADLPDKKPEGISMLGRFSTKARGRFTVPVDFIKPPSASPVVFTSLGAEPLEVELVARETGKTWSVVGFVAALLVGLLAVRRRARSKMRLVIFLLAAGTLVGVWVPAATRAANGVFFAGLLLIPLYLGWALLRAVIRWAMRRIGPQPAAAGAVLAVAMLLAAPAGARAGGAPTKGQAKPVGPPAAEPVLVVPYQGDPTQAQGSAKVLVPYARFVKLWNDAHPDAPIDLPAPASKLSLADVRYEIAVTDQRAELTLTARVRTYGPGAVAVALPMGNLAVTSATLDGKPAALHAGAKGTVLTIPARKRGPSLFSLRLQAVTTPKWLGRRGSVVVDLPPLPAAVTTVTLPGADLELEAPGLDAAPARTKPKARTWTLGLGLHRRLDLRWAPKAGGGATDRTLSASCDHQVYAYHWALVGISRVNLAFSGGEYDRFALLVPESLVLTGLTVDAGQPATAGPGRASSATAAANLKDFRTVGEKVVDGRKFKLLETRLYRPAQKSCAITARWMAPLPALGPAAPLALIRAGDVARESGTVALYAAGGMDARVAGVTGGRKSSAAAHTTAAAAGEQAQLVGRYYWPYRPFGLDVAFTREAVEPRAWLDQLVRIGTDRVELLAQLRLEAVAKGGRVFGASLALPDGYELLSVVGADVGDHYVQTTPTGKRLHVNLRHGSARTELSVVLVRKDYTAPPTTDAQAPPLPVPTVTAIDPVSGAPVPKQQGRLAVQLEASLSASTADSKGLRSIAPRATAGWLDRTQYAAVQFAYQYDKPPIALSLRVARLATKVRVEVFAGMHVGAAAASYTYRLRYHIKGSPIDRVRFTLPGALAGQVMAASRAARSISQKALPGGRTEWTVALVNEVTGLLDVTANFAVPITPRTTALALPRIETDAPAGYRAILAVQNTSRHELAVDQAATHGLAELPADEQRALLAEPVRQSLQFVYHAFAPDWSLGLKLTPAKAASRIQAVVDLMAIITAIDASGQCRYQVQLKLQNRSEQFLRLKIPAGLELWSATVAGQAVKPVKPADGAAGVVLIPLVKTDPTGLPYQVQAYLAGKVVEKFGGWTQIHPPAVQVMGIPVQRTTWELRLPRGYRYARPGGNVSQVAGAAETMVISLDAELGQMERFNESNQDLTLRGQQKVATKNWKYMNENFTRRTEEVLRFLDSNRGEISGSDYRRLRTKVEQQRNTQFGLQGAWAGNARLQEQRAEGNINHWLNNDAPNGGIAEGPRNGALMQLPQFVRSAAQRQEKELTHELQAAAEQQKAIRSKAATAGLPMSLSPNLPGADPQSDQAGRTYTINGATIVTDNEANQAVRLRGLLSDLSNSQYGQALKQQDQVRMQITQLGDNRLNRYYGNLSDSLANQKKNLQPQPQQADGGFRYGRSRESHGEAGGAASGGVDVRAGGAVGGTLDPFAPGGRSSSSRSGVIPGDRGRTDHRLALLGQARDGDADMDKEGIRNENGPMPRGGEDLVSLDTGGAPYVAGGTYSLPVTLPAGAEQLHFAHPSGQPELTLWVIREDTVKAGTTTGAVVAVLVALWIVLALGRLALRRGKKTA